MSLLGTLQLYLRGKAFETDDECDPASLTEHDLSMDDVISPSDSDSMSGSPMDYFSPPKPIVPRFDTTIPIIQRQNPIATPDQLLQKFQWLARQAEDCYRNHIESAYTRLLLPFYRKNFVTSDAWLDDAVINRWFDFLSAQDSSGHLTNVHSRFSEDYLETLSQGGISPAERKRLIDAKTIFLPRNFHGHWYFVSITKQNDYIAINCMDSLSSPEALNVNSGHEHCLEFADKLVKALYGREYENLLISKSREPIPLQMNAIDCGTAICYHAQRICRRLGKEMSPLLDYTPFRLEIAQTLIDAFQSPQEFVNGFIPQGVRQRASKPIAIPKVTGLHRKR